MTLSGFNQEGGKVTGNIGKLVVESRQNTSTTTGKSSGIGLGISANGMPSSVNVSGSRTNGNRSFVDNQSSFIVGEGSNLHVGTLENTGAVIGKQSDNSTTFKIDNYIAKNIYNEDTMTTTGGSIGASLGGKPRITSAGFNQDSRDKEGITRNTVVGNVEIQNASGDEINRDLSKANEITKDTHSSTNINVEPQVIEYISNPTKFKEDLEVAILEGKATGETILKSIENAVNGRKSSDIGDPERRTINEIKESVIRVKTAPEMNAIATGDLNSQEVLNRLNINAIEKFNTDDPDLTENVRARLDELAEDGKTIRAFYDKTTNKIFVNENLTDDAEIRASVAREWKISEDLKTGKGKANDEGQLKSTVAGELAYDDMMKRAREGKTGSISTGELNEAVMDTNSEVTSDKVTLKGFNFTLSAGNKLFGGASLSIGIATGDNKQKRYFVSAGGNLGVGIGLGFALEGGVGVVWGTDDPSKIDGTVWGAEFGVGIKGIGGFTIGANTDGKTVGAGASGSVGGSNQEYEGHVSGTFIKTKTFATKTELIKFLGKKLKLDQFKLIKIEIERKIN